MKYEEIVEIVTERFNEFSEVFYLSEDHGYLPTSLEECLDQMYAEYENIVYAHENLFIEADNPNFITEEMTKVINNFFSKCTDKEGYQTEMIKLAKENFDIDEEFEEYVEEVMKYVKENDDWKDQFIKFLEKLS